MPHKRPAEPCIWVDADACPKPVKEILMRAARNRTVSVLFVANMPLRLSKHKRIEQRLVPGGFDVADDYITEWAGQDDLVITADMPLAQKVIAKQALVVTPYGRELGSDNISEALLMRNLKEELRQSGVQTAGPRPFQNADRQQFANALDKYINYRSGKLND